MSKAENQKKYIKSPKGIAYRASKEFRDSIRKYNNSKRENMRRDVLAEIRKIKTQSGCLKCGYNKHHAALQFHHRDPKTKKFRLGEARGRSLKACLEEATKCDILCANCHAVLESDIRASATIL